ncbi:MAG: leucyl/phenylalanyl-tRNA--protein transferase [Chitinophagales bacterium]|nr:leucyl/phenylalanyl-tRNA--protein transferase [Chitinophagales bacterium]
MVFELSDELIFPHPSLADEDGLLAVGGDLSEDRLLLAYEHGIFPWYSEGEPILWYSPHQRFVLYPTQVKVSHSMRQLIRSAKYEIRFNTAFEEVIRACSEVKRKGQHGTWITDDMINAYIALHQKGIAQSLEVWHNDTLVGGLYGVVVGNVFCGESMFSTLPNASKLALIALCQTNLFSLIDCQLHTPHLESMGACYISREAFMRYLELQ